MEAREQFWGVISFLPPYGSQGFILGRQGWQQPLSYPSVPMILCFYNSHSQLHSQVWGLRDESLVNMPGALGYPFVCTGPCMFLLPFPGSCVLCPLKVEAGLLCLLRVVGCLTPPISSTGRRPHPLLLLLRLVSRLPPNW